MFVKSRTERGWTVIAYPRRRLLMLICITESLVLLLALFMSKLFDIELFPVTGNILRELGTGTIEAIFPLAMFALTLTKKVERIPIMGSLKKITINDIKALFSHMQIMDIVVISALAGFAEELLFRGILQVKFGIVLASVIFGILHCLTPAYFIVATIMGFYLGAVYHYHQSILVPIQLHFVYDFCVLVYLRYFVKDNFVKSS